MRVTSSMYYKSLYGQNNTQLSKKLFDVNKQIASGLKIQYAKDDITTFSETMRLDNEIVTLGQIKSSTESGYKISNQTDVVLNEFDDTMNRMRTLLINAANGTHSDTSLDAIADELRVMEDHFKNLSNTSINGQYLFSGTAVDIKPISADGKYMGNDESMNSFTGSKTQQQYNISGAELFFGEEVLTKREVTSNVMQTNLSEKYDFANKSDNGTLPTPIKVEDTIRDLMGDTDASIDLNNNKHHFYLRGVRSDGTSFNKKMSLSDEDKIQELIDDIGEAYGNTPNLQVVNVSLNPAGQIVVEDKIKGSSKLDFHMVGAVDYANGGGGGDTANVTAISDLDGGETNFNEIINPSSPPAKDLFVREFIKSDYKSATASIANIDGLLYDRTQFVKDGDSLSSNTAQIVRSDNSFAVASTKISEVADISKGTNTTTDDDTLDGNKLTLKGKDIYGVAYDYEINFKSTANGGSNFTDTITGTTYSILDMGKPRVAVDADEMTYQQLMDVVNMVVTKNLPVDSTDVEYDKAIASSNFNGNTNLSHDGKIQFGEINSSNTKAELSMYDSNSGDFSLTTGSVISFNANNAITVRDPKTDFFRELDEMITAVENHKTYPDSKSGDIRNTGIQNAIVKLDDLQEHLMRSHAIVGAQSNALTNSLERTELLEISTMTLRSSVIDTDLAEASLNLTQLSLNYEAMLSTVGKISKLSLVNYL